jgi:dipeptidyl aminopeptidase/acylaminoacyl peptidase
MHPEVQVRPQAAVSFAGIVDPAAQLQYMRDNRDKLPDFLRPFTQHTPSILGWPPRRDVKTRTRYERISVLSYVQNLHVPVCIIHGDQDNIVPVSQAHTLRDRLQQAGKPHRYLEIPGATHMNLMGLPQAWQQVEAFLSEVFH